MALYAVGAADHQDHRVQHRQHPLRLRGKVHVARRVQQRHLQIPQRKGRADGEDGDAPLHFDAVVVEVGVPMVHPAHAAQYPHPVENVLRQGGLARVHVGEYADAQFFIAHVFRPFDPKKEACGTHDECHRLIIKDEGRFDNFRRSTLLHQLEAIHRISDQSEGPGGSRGSRDPDAVGQLELLPVQRVDRDRQFQCGVFLP